MSRPTNLEPTRKRLRKFASPALGGIEPPDVLAGLRRMNARGTLRTARRLIFASGPVSVTASLSGRARDPTADFGGAPPAPMTRHQAAIVAPGEYGQLLHAADP